GDGQALEDAPARSIQQGADLEARRCPGLQEPQEIPGGQARIDDVLDQQDVAAGDLDIEILDQPHGAALGGGAAVAGDGHEVHGDRDRDRAAEVGDEVDGSLQHRDQQGKTAGVVPGDVPREPGDPGGDLLLREEDLLDVFRGTRHRAAAAGCSPYLSSNCR